MQEMITIRTNQERSTKKSQKDVYLLVSISVIGYLSILLFYGFLRHIGLKNAFIEKISPFMAESFLLLIVFAWLLDGANIRKIWISFITYLIMVALVSILTAPTIKSVLLTVRNVLLPIMMLVCLSELHLSSSQIKKLMRRVRVIFVVFTIIGFIFANIQFTLGWEWTSKFFAGYSFWGTNEDQTVRIVQGWFGFNVLGTMGNAAIFGFYNGIAILIYLFYAFRRKIFNLLLISLSFYNILLSGNKTALLAIAILIFFKFLLSFSWKDKKLLFMIILPFIILLVGIIFLIFRDGKFFYTFQMRLELWGELLSNEDYAMNIIFPHNLFYFSAGAGNTGLISFWDNAYLYLLYSIGIVGIIFFLFVIFSTIKKIRAKTNNKFILYLMMYLAAGALTTCVFFGKNIMTLCMIFLGLFAAIVPDEKNILK